jgi:hypothetical protein
MRLREGAWLLFSVVGLSWLIVGTVRSEVDKARTRFAQDTLKYVAGHLALAMDRAAAAGEDPRQWDFPLQGPGNALPGIPADEGSRLAAALPQLSWLPADPWGRSYVVILTGKAEAPYPLVLCAGPEALDLAALRGDRTWSAPVLWPQP